MTDKTQYAPSKSSAALRPLSQNLFAQELAPSLAQL